MGGWGRVGGGGGGGGGDSGLQAAVFVLDSDRCRFCYDGTRVSRALPAVYYRTHDTGCPGEYTSDLALCNPKIIAVGCVYGHLLCMRERRGVEEGGGEGGVVRGQGSETGMWEGRFMAHSCSRRFRSPGCRKPGREAGAWRQRHGRWP